MKNDRTFWPRIRISNTRLMLTSTKILVLLIFGLSLKFLLSAGYLDYVIFQSNKISKTFLLRSINNDVSNDPCLCNGENFCFKGLNETGATINGRKFSCSLFEGLQVNGLLDSDATETINDFEKLDDSWKPIFVSSVASNHFKECRKFVKTIHDQYPASKIIIFDIGLSQEEISELKSWCNVEYKRFNFEKYPEHVKMLKTYAFKLIIIDALKAYKTFFYFDTSVRVTNKNLLDFLHGVQNKDLLPFSTHTFASHSVFSTVHKSMLEYLPVPLIITQMAEIQSTFQFISDAPYTRFILKWWYLCAMTKECVAPSGAIVKCNLHDYHDHKRTYMNCHRFDQAYWNLAALSYLFGDKRGALELGYVDEDWTELNENLIVQIGNARNSAMDRFFKLVNIKREDKIKDKLDLKCK